MYILWLDVFSPWQHWHSTFRGFAEMSQMHLIRETGPVKRQTVCEKATGFISPHIFPPLTTTTHRWAPAAPLLSPPLTGKVARLPSTPCRHGACAPRRTKDQTSASHTVPLSAVISSRTTPKDSEDFKWGCRQCVGFQILHPCVDAYSKSHNRPSYSFICSSNMRSIIHLHRGIIWLPRAWILRVHVKQVTALLIEEGLEEALLHLTVHFNSLYVYIMCWLFYVFLLVRLFLSHASKITELGCKWYWQ